MSLPDPIPPRKPRRLGLYLPFFLLLLGVVAWSGFWFWARIQTREQMDAQAEALRAAGYDITWRTRSVGGFPFRMDTVLTDATIRDPSGWSLSAPRLEGEAYMHALGHWILAAPQGLTFARPLGGPVRVTGRLVRASLRDADRIPPAFSFEGVDVAFQPAPGAQPFALTAAERVEFHLRPGPDDEGGVFFKVDGGKARAGTFLARLAGAQPVVMRWNSTLSRVSALRGANWGEAVRAWTAAGGRMSVRDARLGAGETGAEVSGGTLGVGPDGRVAGTLDVALRKPEAALAALAQSGAIPPEAAQAAGAVLAARQGPGPAAAAAITFQAGRATLGPVAIAPAPHVY